MWGVLAAILGAHLWLGLSGLPAWLEQALYVGTLLAVAYALVRHVRFPLVLMIAVLAAGGGLPRVIGAPLGLDDTTMLLGLGAVVVLALLHYAAVLVPRGERLPFATDNGVKTLMRAVDKGDIGYTLRMLDMGVDVDGRDAAEETALMHAARRGYADMVELLLERGAEPDLANRHGDTALTLALMRGYGRIAELLRRASLGHPPSAGANGRGNGAQARWG